MGDLFRRLGVPTALATIALVLAPGGAGSQSATVKVAFLQGEQVVYVNRSGSTLRQAVTALLAGPTAAERKREIASAVPAGTPLRAVSVANGVATVDLGERFATGTKAASLSARVTQLVLTVDLRPGCEVGPPARQGRHPARALPRLCHLGADRASGRNEA